MVYPEYFLPSVFTFSRVLFIGFKLLKISGLWFLESVILVDTDNKVDKIIA